MFSSTSLTVQNTAARLWWEQFFDLKMTTFWWIVDSDKKYEMQLWHYQTNVQLAILEDHLIYDYEGFVQFWSGFIKTIDILK